jgi:hypothetical protein
VGRGGWPGGVGLAAGFWTVAPGAAGRAGLPGCGLPGAGSTGGWDTRGQRPAGGDRDRLGRDGCGGLAEPCDGWLEVPGQVPSPEQEDQRPEEPAETVDRDGPDHLLQKERQTFGGGGGWVHEQIMNESADKVKRFLHRFRGPRLGPLCDMRTLPSYFYCGCPHASPTYGWRGLRARAIGRLREQNEQNERTDNEQ